MQRRAWHGEASLASPAAASMALNCASQFARRNGQPGRRFEEQTAAGTSRRGRFGRHEKATTRNQDEGPTAPNPGQRWAGRGVRLPSRKQLWHFAPTQYNALCRGFDAGSRTQVPQPPTPPKSNLTSDGFSLDVASPGTPSPRPDPHLDRLDEDGNARLRRWRLGRRVNQHSSAVSGESLPHTLSLPRELTHQAALCPLHSAAFWPHPLSRAHVFPDLCPPCASTPAPAHPPNRASG